MKVELSRQATRQLSRIGAYLSRRSPAGAKSVRAAIRVCMRTLETFPAAGTPQHVRTVRKFVDSRYRYRLYYVVGSDTITIISIPPKTRKLLNSRCDFKVLRSAARLVRRAHPKHTSKIRRQLASRTNAGS